MIMWLTGSCGSLQPPNITKELHTKYLSLAKDQDSKYSSTKGSFLHYAKSRSVDQAIMKAGTIWLVRSAAELQSTHVSRPVFLHSTMHTTKAGATAYTGHCNSVVEDYPLVEVKAKN